LDVYWAQTAGADPAAAVAELGGRLRSIHWKDGPCAHGEPMTALGQGKVDVRRILQAITRPADWGIELDECATDPLEAARQTRGCASSAGGPAAVQPNSPRQRGEVMPPSLVRGGGGVGEPIAWEVLGSAYLPRKPWLTLRQDRVRRLGGRPAGAASRPQARRR